MQRLQILALLAVTACAGATKTHIVDTPPPPVVTVSDPNVIVLEAALGNELVRAQSASELIARLRVDTRDIERASRPRLNLALAIDTSGSMEGDAIDHAREAAIALVDELDDGDHLSVVAFNSSAQVLLATTAISKNNRTELKDAISAMQARGTTAMTQGLGQAFAQARKGRLADGVNRIVLLSDGVPNDESALRGLADQARQNGIAITALGLGVDYNETLLADISQRSGGTFHYVESSEQVAEVFEKEIIRLERVVARNLTLMMNPGPGVTVKDVIGYQAPRSGRSNYVILGNISAGEQRDVYVRLTVGDHRDGATVELMDVALSFQDAVVNAGSLRRDLFLSARATESEAKLEQGVNVDIMRDALRAELAAVVVNAIASARAGNLQVAQELLVANEPRARKAAETYDDESFTTQADDMLELKASLPAIVPKVQVQQPVPVQPDVPQVESADDVPAAAPANVRRNHSKAVGTIKRPRYRAR